MTVLLQQSYLANSWAKCVRTSFPFRCTVVHSQVRRSELSRLSIRFISYR